MLRPPETADLSFMIYFSSTEWVDRALESGPLVHHLTAACRLVIEQSNCLVERETSGNDKHEESERACMLRMRDNCWIIWCIRSSTTDFTVPRLSVTSVIYPFLEASSVVTFEIQWYRWLVFCWNSCTEDWNFIQAGLGGVHHYRKSAKRQSSSCPIHAWNSHTVHDFPPQPKMTSWWRYP